jgi:redox-sensitive bicupin YhaK (pirin superfamily)
MIKLQRSTARRYVRSGSQETWMTFDPANGADPFHRGFRTLDVLNEVKLLPGAEFRLQSDGNHESVTYVREGRLVARQRPRRDEVLGPGYYQRANSQHLMAAGASDTSPFQSSHLFVSSMTPHRQEREPSCERRHHPFADRHGILRLIASPEGCAASLRLQQDVRIYSSVLDPGHHVVHELSPGRGGWLHVIAGRIRLINQCLEAGDGASLDDELAVSFTAQEASEILLFDLA